MAFTAQDVKNLRELTGCGMMDCKKALTECDGDADKAVAYLREKGLAAVAKKAGRIAAEGMVYASVNGNVGVALEVNAETDFVAKNESFQEFVKNVAQVVEEKNPADVEALLACELAGGTVADALQEKIQVIGENIKIRRFNRYEGICSAYIHAGGTHAVLVNFAAEGLAGTPAFEAFGKDIAMQIAAVNPRFISKDEVDEKTIAEEREVLAAQIENDPAMAGKPEKVKEGIVSGRISKFYKESCLLEQPFVKDGDITVATYVANTAKELGGAIEILSFTRYEKGEGIEKKEDDFAAEVAGMVK